MTAVAPQPTRSSTALRRFARPDRPARPGSNWHRVTPLLVALLSAAGVAGVHHFFLRTALGQEVDTTSMIGGDLNHPRVTEILGQALQYTHLTLLGLVCVLAAAFGVVRRRLDLAIGAFVLVAGANITTQYLKSSLSRPELDGIPMPNSFPSGHVTAAASVAFVLVLVFPRALRGTIGLIGAVYVTVVAVATVWADWHRPSDAFGALLIVLAWGALVIWFVRLRRSREVRPLHLPNRLVVAVLGVGGAITAVAASLGLLAVVLSERGSPDLVSERFAFLTGAAGIVACAAVVFILWVRLTADEPPAAGSDLGGTK